MYNVLPFGLTTSASVFCAFTEVTARAVRASGLVSALIVYVDDFGGSVGQHRDRARMDSIVCSIGYQPTMIMFFVLKLSLSLVPSPSGCSLLATVL